MFSYHKDNLTAAVTCDILLDGVYVMLLRCSLLSSYLLSSSLLLPFSSFLLSSFSSPHSLLSILLSSFSSFLLFLSSPSTEVCYLLSVILLHSNFSKTKFIHPSIYFLYLLISIQVTGQMKMCFIKLQKQYHACCCPCVTQMQPAPVLLPLIKTTKDSRVTWGCGQ